MSAQTVLTRRQREVVRLLATGMNQQEIAGALCIERATVKNMVASARDRIGARTTAHLVALWVLAEVNERTTAS